MAKKKSTSSASTATIGFEATLWQAAETLQTKPGAVNAGPMLPLRAHCSGVRSPKAVLPFTTGVRSALAVLPVTKGVAAEAIEAKRKAVRTHPILICEAKIKPPVASSEELNRPRNVTESRDTCGFSPIPRELLKYLRPLLAILHSRLREELAQNLHRYL